MTGRKNVSGQLELGDYQLKAVDVRLKLMDGPTYYSQTPISTPADAAQVMRDVLKGLDREWLVVVNMDSHLKPVNVNVVSIGSLDGSLAPIQNILKSTILSNCNRFLLMHNHPSGEVAPSQDDMKVTKFVAAAAKLMDMSLEDHLIVGGQTGGLYSFREEYPSLFSGSKMDFDLIRQMTEKDVESPDKKSGHSKKKTKDSVREKLTVVKDTVCRAEGSGKQMREKSQEAL